jgi:N6-adenosine-specific RNA methylase IME4
MKRVGFRYVTNIAWVKDKVGLGQYIRGQHELLLFSVRGHLPYKQDGEKRNFIRSVIEAPRREHSQKPDEQYAIIEATSYPPYIEAFARNHREGWEVVGLEAPDPVIISQKSILF